MQSPPLERLPVELVIYLLTFLEARDVVALQRVNKCLFKITRDNGLWKVISYNGLDAKFGRLHQALEIILSQRLGSQNQQILDAQWVTSSGFLQSLGNENLDGNQQRAQAMNRGNRGYRIANWDPSILGETVDWYGEYIGRHAPMALGWLQQPSMEPNDKGQKIDVRGLGLLNNGDGKRIAVAPLDDGGVCMWDLDGQGQSPTQTKGKICARSRSDLLSVKGHGTGVATSKAAATSTDVVECVSIDNSRKKAYFAAQSGLNEIDLETLQVVAHSRYPSSISALSSATYPLPLTVGTTDGLHLHDPRMSNNFRLAEIAHSRLDKVESEGTFRNPLKPCNGVYRLPSSDQMKGDAPFFQRGPLSIVHSTFTNARTNQGDIYVAGRFPSILVYDRRTFPKLRQIIHSRASLCCLISLPYHTSQISALSRVQAPKESSIGASASILGETLIACGGHNGKGALMMHGLSKLSSQPPTFHSPAGANPSHISYKNHGTVSRSKILSITSHGTRLLFSDADGKLNWFERDGTTVVRRWDISQPDPIASRSARGYSRGLFSTSSDLGSGDVARKILTLGEGPRDEIVLWTGDRIGVVGFGKRWRLSLEEEKEEDGVESEEDRIMAREESHRRRMRRSFERYANDVRIAKAWGLGTR